MNVFILQWSHLSNYKDGPQIHGVYSSREGAEMDAQRLVSEHSEEAPTLTWVGGAFSDGNWELLISEHEVLGL